MVYLDWLQAVLVGDSRCTWKWQSSEVSDTLRGRDRMSLEMHFGGRNRVSLEMHLGGRDWASLEMHLEAVIGGV